jgi:Arabinose-binding domain of AraC transcription regulator, N-term
MTAMVRASGHMGYSSLMRSLGVDPLPLLRRHGLSPDHGENEDVLVPLRAAIRLMEESAAAARCPDLGLRLAAGQDIRILGPLAAAMQHSPTVGEALHTASRYLFVQSPALAFSVIQPSSLVPKGVELRVDIVLPKLAVRRQVMDQCLGDLHRILQFLARDNYKLLAGCAAPYTGCGGTPLYAVLWRHRPLEPGVRRVTRDTADVENQAFASKQVLATDCSRIHEPALRRPEPKHVCAGATGSELDLEHEPRKQVRHRGLVVPAPENATAEAGAGGHDV